MLDFVLTQHNLVIAAAIYMLLGAVKKSAPELVQHRLWARIEPLAPVLLASAAVWIPGLAATQGLGIGDRIMLGLVIGAIVAYGHKLFRQSLLGRDDRIQLRQ